jgi:hypothetical protein
MRALAIIRFCLLFCILLAAYGSPTSSTEAPTKKLFDDSHEAVDRSKTVGPYSSGSWVKLYIENGGRHYSDSKDCKIEKIDDKTYLLKFEDATDYEYNDIVVRVNLLPSLTNVVIDGKADDWTDYPILLIDGEGDTFKGGFDLKSVRAFTTDKYLCLMLMVKSTSTCRSTWTLTLMAMVTRITWLPSGHALVGETSATSLQARRSGRLCKMAWQPSPK